MSKQYFLKGTLILTCAGLVTRFIGFFYRIFLSHTIGAQDLGIYQLVSPLQMLVLSITTFGIQTAISRLAASRLAVGKSRDAGDIFFLGAGISVFLSSLLAWVLYHNSAFFSAEILKETQTEPFIRLLSFGLPLSSLHICANGYYFARKKAEIPSGIQFLEQLVRVGVTYLLYQIFLSEGREITAFIAVGGSLASEGAAAFVSLLAIGGSFHKHNYTPLPLSQPAKKIGDILQLSFPLSVNRVLLTLLSSIEVVLIPQRLRMYGLGSEEALSIYGILTGMVMPLLLFPSTITNSASVMLMPSIAELQALGYSRRIRYVISQAGKYCFSLGGACTFVFFFFGKFLGEFLFHSPTAGIYIQTMAFICPFMYLNTALSSILNGLGKTGANLVHSAVSTGIRIAFVLFAIPLLGIRGYLYGVLLGEILLSGMHIFSLRPANFPIDNFSGIVYNSVGKNKRK